MKVTVFHSGPAANESELKAIQHLDSRLRSEPGDEHWILLANHMLSVNNQFQSDEIDLIVIGPTGVQVIEVKHWTSQWFDLNQYEVEGEADRIAMKAKKVATTLRRVVPELPFVGPAILLTQDRSQITRLAGKDVRGVRFHTLNDWRVAIGLDNARVLSPQQVMVMAGKLEPRTPVAIDGSLRRLAGYINLELQTPKDQCFHRVYKGSHHSRRDRVVLHLYDLSASDEKNAEVKARREFEALYRLQIHQWVPRVLDSYQDAPGYAGEMFFFTVIDPAAPSIEERAKDETWGTNSRLLFARSAVQALTDIQGGERSDDPIIHRNLTPRTILVRHDNKPILTGFEHTRIPSEISVGSGSPLVGSHPSTIAPEIQIGGMAAADNRSDVFSLCASLRYLFQEREDDPSVAAWEILVQGLAEKPNDRCTLQDLDEALAKMLGEEVPAPVGPARLWTEDQIIRFGKRDYRIVSRLGSGGVGMTFKVRELDVSTQEDQGTYVAKVAHDEKSGLNILKAYSLARSHLPGHTALSTIFEVGNEWDQNEFSALMQWIPGTPLMEFSGVFPLLAEEQQELSGEALAIRWISVICEALGVLHRNGLVHGDVSPKNMIVSGSNLVLTDYDFVSKVGEPTVAPGTILYCSPSHIGRHCSADSDDIYALAASFFHVVFEKEPFRYGEELDKERGLNWEGVNRGEYPTIAAFLDKATHQDSQSRFASVTEALAAFEVEDSTDRSTQIEKVEPDQAAAARKADQPQQSKPEVQLSEQRVDWLLNLLQVYPGSRWGNRETRGLDTDFAAQTYVETDLAGSLFDAIVERSVRLVILCGNAGDGKTTLLQYLGDQLGLGKHQSSERVLEGQVVNGPFVRINLDGAASWNDRSADEILDEFMAPFQDGPPDQDLVHMVAINDGRLMEWIEGFEDRNGGLETALTKELYDLLGDESAMGGSHIRFVSLNQRSIVGGLSQDKKRIDTRFVEQLLDKLYGGQQATEIWAPCQSCSANERCEVFGAAHVFGPTGLHEEKGSSVRSKSRQRLFEALQAVHLRGETHITVRGLRAALVYILFGVNFCDDYHAGSDPQPIPYWDRAFSPDSPGRQGEVLSDLALFDPALEAHPQIDRRLMSKITDDKDAFAPRYPGLSIASARRRAYFEWTPDQVEQVAGDPDALRLARGMHLRKFRDLPLQSEPQQLQEICRDLCRGIARLEDLPLQALDRPDIVPLRVTPRTPTETAFWAEKPLSSFRLTVDSNSDKDGLERLHRQAFLIYRYRNGGEESLRLGAELFHLLLELADGYQLGDASTDDTFAHLAIFVQRLVREDDRQLMAWNPMQGETIYSISSTIREAENHVEQSLVITPLAEGAAT